MSSPRFTSRLSGAVPARGLAAPAIAVLVLGACDRDRPPPTPDSVVGASTAVVAAAPVPAARVSAWNGDAGAALVVRNDAGDAVVVIPGEAGDSTTDSSAGAASSVLPGDVALFTRAGAAGHAKAELATPGATGQCVRWPLARLGPASGADAVPAWTVGFARGAPTPIALDSLEGASAADSAGLAAVVTRLASGLHDDTVRVLRGVPFSVRSARRFTLADGTQGLVAVLTRALNQEAAPVGEQVLLVAERSGAPTGAPASSPATWSVAYDERAAGSEEIVPATDVLAAVALGRPQRPTLVLARALANGNRYSLLERTGDHTWRIRWTSVEGGC
jgi:hypothetical protein